MDTLVCPVCGTANRPEARFCWSCGAALVKTCPQCNAHNRPWAQFCIRCGGRLAISLALERGLLTELPSGGRETASSNGGAAPSASLRLLEADTYPGFGWSQDKQAVAPIRCFGSGDTAFYIRLRLANLNPLRQHSHRLFVQFFRPNGRLHLSRERPELVVASAGQTEVEASIFGLRISGTEVVNHPGAWRAVVYLDEQKMIELHFEVVR